MCAFCPLLLQRQQQRVASKEKNKMASQLGKVMRPFADLVCVWQLDPSPGLFTHRPWHLLLCRYKRLWKTRGWTMRLPSPRHPRAAVRAAVAAIMALRRVLPCTKSGAFEYTCPGCMQCFCVIKLCAPSCATLITTDCGTLGCCVRSWRCQGGGRVVPWTCMKHGSTCEMGEGRASALPAEAGNAHAAVGMPIR